MGSYYKFGELRPGSIAESYSAKSSDTVISDEPLALIISCIRNQSMMFVTLLIKTKLHNVTLFDNTHNIRYVET